MRTPASTPAAPIAALDTRIAPTQPPPSPNGMMTATLDNPSTTGTATRDPPRPVSRDCSYTGHTATALCTCNVHRLPAPNVDMNKSMTTTQSGRRPPSTYSVALPAALLLPSGTTQQIESDLTTIVAYDPTTITAGLSLWPSQSRSTECREGPPNQAPADHADVLTYLARRGLRYSLQCTLCCWHLSWTLAFLAPHAAHCTSLSPPAACLGPPAAHDASPSSPVTRLLAPPSQLAISHHRRRQLAYLLCLPLAIPRRRRRQLACSLCLPLATPRHRCQRLTCLPCFQLAMSHVPSAIHRHGCDLHARHLHRHRRR